MFTFTVHMFHPAEHGEAEYWAVVVRATFAETDHDHTVCLLSSMIEAHATIARGERMAITVERNGNPDVVTWEGSEPDATLIRARKLVEAWA